MYARELRARFGWSRGTTDLVLKYLVDHLLVERVDFRTEGKFAGVAYRDPKTGENQVHKTDVQNPGIRSPGRRTSGHKHIKPPTEGAPNTYALNTRTPASAPQNDEKQDIFENSVLMGWLGPDNQADQALKDVSGDALDAIWNLYPDDEPLRALVLDACDRRVAKVICSTAGLEAVRWLAAFVYHSSDPNHLDARGAMTAVLFAMWDAVGSKRGKKLNSLALIGKRIASEIYGAGDCHAVRFYRHEAPYVPPADRRAYRPPSPKDGTL